MLLSSRQCKPGQQGLLRTRQSISLPQRHVIVRATATDEDADLEARLEKLRQVKGATPYGKGKSRQQKQAVVTEKVAVAPVPGKITYDFSDEKMYYQGPPHRGDLVINLLLGTTLFWLPLTFASIGRAAFVNYKFTDKRVSIASTAPWKQEQTEAAYQEVKEVKYVPRGIGLWADMVIVLNNGDKLELRALDRFKELKDYILARRDELAPPGSGGGNAADISNRKGGEVTAAELMGEAPKKKGFA